MNNVHSGEPLVVGEVTRFRIFFGLTMVVVVPMPMALKMVGH